MTCNQYENKNVMPNFFMERLNNNKENTLGFITEIEFFITDNQLLIQEECVMKQ